MDGEWSVEKVLQVIIINCRSWRGDGMKVHDASLLYSLGEFFLVYLVNTDLLLPHFFFVCFEFFSR